MQLTAGQWPFGAKRTWPPPRHGLGPHSLTPAGQAANSHPVTGPQNTGSLGQHVPKCAAWKVHTYSHSVTQWESYSRLRSPIKSRSPPGASVCSTPSLKLINLPFQYGAGLRFRLLWIQCLSGSSCQFIFVLCFSDISCPVTDASFLKCVKKKKSWYKQKHRWYTDIVEIRKAGRSDWLLKNTGWVTS